MVIQVDTKECLDRLRKEAAEDGSLVEFETMIREGRILLNGKRVMN